MNTKIIFSIFCYFHFLLSELYLCDKLRFVFGVFRHGARAPWKSLNENNIDLLGSRWEGESQLTDVGIRQHYLLGYKNKQKYFSKMNITNYNPNEVSIFSTDTDRTIMSVYSELFGMFPPGSGPKLLKDQLPFAQPPIKTFNFSQKQDFLKDDVLQAGVAPFPVHLFDKYANYFNLNDPKLCPKVKDYQDQNIKSEKFLNYSNSIIMNYGDRIIKLLNKTDINELKDYYSMYYVFDTFIANFYDGRKIDKLLNETGLNFDEFYNLTIDFLTWDQFYINYGDKESIVARMSFSPIFKYLFDVIDKRIKIDSSDGKLSSDYYDSLNPKMLLYSGHDTNLAAMNVFLSYMFGEDRVKHYYTYFASSFYFELYKNETNSKQETNELEEDYYLNVLFNEINIFGKPILYKEFKDQIKYKLMNTQDINKFCNFKGAEYNNHFLLIIILAILILVCLTFVYLIYKKTNNNLDYDYEKQTNSLKI